MTGRQLTLLLVILAVLAGWICYHARRDIEDVMRYPPGQFVPRDDLIRLNDS